MYVIYLESISNPEDRTQITQTRTHMIAHMKILINLNVQAIGKVGIIY